MSDLALVFTLAFILLTIVLSKWQKVGLEKDILIGTIRAAIQLLGVGYILHIIFELETWYFIVSLLSVMILIATFNAANKWKELKGYRWRIGLAITITEIITMSIVLGFGIVEADAKNIIPISGMIIGNSMVVSALFLNRIKSEMETKLEEVKVYLALGATSKQAFKNIKANTVKASMIPIIDGMKTVGLVQLPGMMTGMIIAGASPMEAVRYQILIMYSLTASSAITSIMLGVLSHSLIFNNNHQLQSYYQMK